jgi:hypothetical protein
MLAIVSWNLLHVSIGWLLPVLNADRTEGFVAWLATKHGFAGSCFSQV